MAKVKDLQNANQVGWNVVGFCGELDLSPGSLQGTQKFDFQGTCRNFPEKVSSQCQQILFQVFPQSHFQQVEEGNQVDLQPLSQRFRSKFSALRIDQFPHRYLTKEPCGAMCRIFHGDFTGASYCIHCILDNSSQLDGDWWIVDCYDCYGCYDCYLWLLIIVVMVVVVVVDDIDGVKVPLPVTCRMVLLVDGFFDSIDDCWWRWRFMLCADGFCVRWLLITRLLLCWTYQFWDTYFDLHKQTTTTAYN